MNVLEYILAKRQMGQHMLAVLLDPEHEIRFRKGELDAADLIFVGGSTGAISPLFIDKIRAITHRPIVLFPGNPSQFSPQADALLYLSVLSSRNPDLLVGRQIDSAQVIAQSGIEVLPMGYILIDGGIPTSVVQTCQSAPIPQDQITLITSTALAGQMMGKQLIYLEAGSGAKNPVSIDIINAVRQAINIPLIVGGGITTPQMMKDAFRAGADIVVIGNHFERHPEELHLFY
ncbi:MAG: phosphoglycerol geranylgeranyltransferase [Paludibacteraceae bacterium]|nr:phosphoglycerol geranylgeranyltransferase [Paludibacteraceae bacterium]